MIKKCSKHGDTDHAPRLDKRNNTTAYRCRKCEYDSVHKRRKNLKIRLVEFHGGKCIKCGYNKSTRALCFHHRDPTQKDFPLSMESIIGWEKLKKEAEKCDLLCSNCHMEEHDRLELMDP